MKIKITSWNVDENFDKKVLAELPTEMDVPNECTLDDDFETDNVFDYVNDKVGVAVYDYIVLPTKENAKILWEKLSDVSVDVEDNIEADWYIFTAGTNKIDIWKWFEEYFHVSVAEDLMQ